MKHFLISYRLKEGREEQRRREIEGFVAAIDGDPDLRGRVSYWSVRKRDGNEYFHIASVADDAARQALQSREFFTRYTAATDDAAIGEVDVSPLEVVAETSAPIAASA